MDDLYDLSTSDPVREIVNTRELLAPPDAVVRAFCDPLRLVRWWGPAGFTNQIDAFDLRPGGTWSITMTGPDGTAYHNESRFVVVEPPNRIIYVHEGPVHRFRMTMTFSRHPAGTQLTWRMLFDDPAEAEKLRPFLLQANEQNFDRLQQLLDRES